MKWTMEQGPEDTAPIIRVTEGDLPEFVTRVLKTGEISFPGAPQDPWRRLVGLLVRYGFWESAEVELDVYDFIEIMSGTRVERLGDEFVFDHVHDTLKSMLLAMVRTTILVEGSSRDWGFSVASRYEMSAEGAVIAPSPSSNVPGVDALRDEKTLLETKGSLASTTPP